MECSISSDFFIHVDRSKSSYQGKQNVPAFQKGVGGLILFAADHCVYSAHFVVANRFLAAYFGGHTRIFSLPVFFCPSKPKFIATFPLIFSLLGRPRGRDKAPGLQFYVSLSGTNRVSNTRSVGEIDANKSGKNHLFLSVCIIA